MYKKRLLSVFVVLSCVCCALAGDTTRVVGDYGQLVNQGIEAYQRQDTAQARLSWERALLIDPAGEEAIQNITFLRRNMPSEVIPLPPFVLSKWWRSIYTLCSPDVWMYLQLVAVVLLLVLLYRHWLGPGVRTSVLVVVFLLAILTYLAGYSEKARRGGNDHAVVLQHCPLQSGPDLRSDSLLILAPGQKVQILRQLDDWLEVARMDRVAGWTSKTCVEKI